MRADPSSPVKINPLPPTSAVVLGSDYTAQTCSAMHEKKVALGSSTPEPNKALEPTIMHTIHAKACGYLGWLNILVKQDRVEMELNLLHAGLSPHCFLSICYFAVVTETKKGRVDANGHVSIGRSP